MIRAMHEGEEDHLSVETFNGDPENFNILLQLFKIMAEQDIRLNSKYYEEYLPWSLFSEMLDVIRVLFGLSRGKF